MFVQAGSLCQWTADSQRLILEYFDTINTSPSHIYCSALRFPPSLSWLHQYYSVRLSQEVKVVRGLSTRWGACFRIVSLDKMPHGLACWKDIIAVGLSFGCIMTLNAITGSKIAVLSGHTNQVVCLTFSQDGTMLVSGSDDRTIKLWDMQTGGVVKNFQGHTKYVTSVSISPNCTTIASGSGDDTIRLWDIQTGECYCIIQQKSQEESIYFFPLDPDHFISVSKKQVQKWNIDGHKIRLGYDGSCAAFSCDGTKLVLCNEGVIQVQSLDSRAVIAEFHIDQANACCFSPDGRLVAVSTEFTAYVWDITNPKPCLIETFIYTEYIISLAFSSPTSLISISTDRSVRFWQIGASSTSPDTSDINSTPHTPPIKSITLQAKDGIAISTDLDGVVKIWDLSTGLCKASFQTPAKGSCLRDVQLIHSRLVLVWHADKKIYIWDIEKGELLQTVDAPMYKVRNLKISGDGSKFFCITGFSIHAWYTLTGKVMGKVKLPRYSESFSTVDSSKVWVQIPDQGIEGWDFGVPKESSIKHYTKPPNRPHLDFIGGIRKERPDLPGIEDTITGRVFFQLPSRYPRPNDVQWNGQYLVAGYETGEVMILDCNCMLAH